MEEKNWFLYITDHHEGPFSIAEIKQKMKQGAADSHCYVWKEGMEDWIMMNEVSDFGSGLSDSAAAKPIFINQPQSSKAKSTTYKALGLSGKASTTSYKWYKSTKFFFILMLLCFAGVYQSLAKGYLDVILSATGQIKKVKDLGLKPIPIPEVSELKAIAGKVKIEDLEKEVAKHWNEINPYYLKIQPYLPEQAKVYFSKFTFKIPDDLKAKLNANQIETLKDAVLANISTEARVVSFMVLGDEATPSFYVGSNLGNQTKIKITLRSKENSVLAIDPIYAETVVTLQDHLGISGKFMSQQGPLPLGEYLVMAYEDDGQVPEVAAVLQKLPKKSTPNGVPAGKVAFVVDSYFLGGRRDPLFSETLQRYNEEKVKAKESTMHDLSQTLITVESLANESATKFFELMKTKKLKSSKMKWNAYHGQYSKINTQIKELLGKEIYGKYEPVLYKKILDIFLMAENLHKLENDYIIQTGDLGEIQKEASKISDSINSIKGFLEKK